MCNRYHNYRQITILPQNKNIIVVTACKMIVPAENAIVQIDLRINGRLFLFRNKKFFDTATIDFAGGGSGY